MHHVLNLWLPPDDLPDVFSRIFAFIDQALPNLFLTAASKPSSNGSPAFQFPTTDAGKLRFLTEMEVTIKQLNGLDSVQPWDFTCI